MNLVIVETPAQAKILSSILGQGWRVEPCHGWVRDLTTDRLGVDVKHDFRPTLVIPPGKGNLVRRLLKAISTCDAIYAATPPNPSGEAMAWHILALSPDVGDKPIYRVTLDAITSEAVRTAFAAPRPLNMKRVESAMTERILDRLIGFGVNLQASKTLSGRIALSYGGMVTLRVLAEQHPQDTDISPRWTATVAFHIDGEAFTAQVFNTKGAPLRMRSDEQTEQLEHLLKSAQFWVEQAVRGTKIHPAPAILNTVRLIETANREWGLAPQRTLALVASLYDMGWITHPDAQPLPDSQAAQAHIQREYGNDYLAPDLPAHQGIAPTDVARLPENLPGDGAALYGLIWRYFIAAHMTPAVERVSAARIFAGASPDKRYPLELRLQVKRLYFDGWKRVFMGELPAGTPAIVPVLKQGQALAVEQVTITPEVTLLRPLVTEGTLVATLTGLGLAAQSVADLIEPLHDFGFITGEGVTLALTDDGREVADYLAEVFGELTSTAYAARRAADLSLIVSGEVSRLEVLRAFLERFGDTLRPATRNKPIVTAHKPIILHRAEEA